MSAAGLLGPNLVSGGFSRGGEERPAGKDGAAAERGRPPVRRQEDLEEGQGKGIKAMLAFSVGQPSLICLPIKEYRLHFQSRLLYQ